MPICFESGEHIDWPGWEQVPLLAVEAPEDVPDDELEPLDGDAEPEDPVEGEAPPAAAEGAAGLPEEPADPEEPLDDPAPPAAAAEGAAELDPDEPALACESGALVEPDEVDACDAAAPAAELAGAAAEEPEPEAAEPDEDPPAEPEEAELPAAPHLGPVGFANVCSFFSMDEPGLGNAILVLSGVVQSLTGMLKRRQHKCNKNIKPWVNLLCNKHGWKRGGGTFRELGDCVL